MYGVDYCPPFAHRDGFRQGAGHGRRQDGRIRSSAQFAEEQKWDSARNGGADWTGYGRFVTWHCSRGILSNFGAVTHILADFAPPPLFIIVTSCHNVRILSPYFLKFPPFLNKSRLNEIIIWGLTLKFYFNFFFFILARGQWRDITRKSYTSPRSMANCITFLDLPFSPNAWRVVWTAHKCIRDVTFVALLKRAIITSAGR